MWPWDPILPTTASYLDIHFMGKCTGWVAVGFSDLEDRKMVILNCVREGHTPSCVVSGMLFCSEVLQDPTTFTTLPSIAMHPSTPPSIAMHPSTSTSV